MSTNAESTPTQSDKDEYVVVARRYRPQSFSELIGQEHVAKALEQAIRSGRIGHAYLFTGARGVGKTSAARILAKALNCVKGPTPTPCNNCDVCLSVASGDDVDVLEIDGASNRGIDEIRQLRQNAGIRPTRVRFKIYIIDEVHMLTKEAFNALLKTLEEPPEHVKFIFATTEPNKIPITILSRCQRFDFAGIESGSIRERLSQIAQAEGVGIEEEALQIIAARAAGSMRDSQSLLEQLLAAAGQSITAQEVNELLGIAPAARIAEIAERLLARDPAAALSALDTAVNGGADPGEMIDQLMGFYRDAMALAVGCPPERMLSVLPAQVEATRALAEAMGVNTLLASLQVLDQTASRMRVSVHQRTLVDMAIVRLSTLGDLDELSDLVASVASGQQPIAPPKAQAPPRARVPVPAPAPVARKKPVAETPVVPPAEPEVSSQPVEPPPAASDPVASDPVKKEGSTPNGSHASAPETASKASEPSDDKTSSNGESLLEQFAEMQKNPGKASKVEPRVSRRQQQAEIAQQPFVRKAIELFGSESSKLRYIPPKDEN